MNSACCFVWDTFWFLSCRRWWFRLTDFWRLLTSQFSLRDPFDGLPRHEFPYPWAAGGGQDEFGVWTTFSFQGVDFCFRWMTPGTFMIGTPPDNPRRMDHEFHYKVTLTRGFWLGEATVTQALWEAVMGDNPSKFRGENRPVEMVSWFDANGFIERLNNRLPEMGFRLPTEAEWEYACRAGTTTDFAFGDSLTLDLANIIQMADGPDDDHLCRKETLDVDALPCNTWGLRQMHGNVCEWVRDGYLNVETEHEIDPCWPDHYGLRVLRGGCWAQSSFFCCSAFREEMDPKVRAETIGFRLAAEHPAVWPWPTGPMAF